MHRASRWGRGCILTAHGARSVIQIVVNRMPKNVGSIYRVEVGDDEVRYFWDVATDATQLSSAVIVVFRRRYPKTSTADVDEITSDDVDFYCHTMISVGKKLGLWSRVGFKRVDRSFSMLFRDSGDYGNPKIRVSDHWYVWEPNKPFRNVGKLSGDLTKAEVGVVMNPAGVVNRMRTGFYGIVYPAYAESCEPRA